MMNMVKPKKFVEKEDRKGGSSSATWRFLKAINAPEFCRKTEFQDIPINPFSFASHIQMLC